jgi:hypothetical protein
VKFSETELFLKPFLLPRLIWEIHFKLVLKMIQEKHLRLIQFFK